MSDPIDDAAAPERCIACGDVAVIAEIIKLHGLTALVEHDGRHETMAIDLVPTATVGDRVLCHAGVALELLAAPQPPSPGVL
jgi:hydrogenase maturation factor